MSKDISITVTGIIVKKQVATYSDIPIEVGSSSVLVDLDFVSSVEFDLLFRENCLVELDKILHPDNIHVVRILVGAFAASVKLEEWTKAIDYGKRLDRAFGLYLPPNEPDTGLLYYKMGKAYYHLDDIETAVTSLRKAKTLLSIAYGRDSQLADYAQDWLELCGDYRSSSEEDETDSETSCPSS
ncbi:N-lysine methyltransferase SMYD2-A-like [Branchiostoma floridae]|uniref:N-lysine methyltransferase SMYD2-A-like n=1 Tax=Branchiostoma floridae TaxID=7739 RepID=A0A9J7M3K4_BRAFL|nr:N-lysine methyltransferase SMYD2-A-like [Branchiostoma floridae]